MLWCYDKALCDDLRNSFNRGTTLEPVVKVVEPEDIIGLAAQIQDDQISLPLIAVGRDADTSIDTTRTNFSRMHNGVASVIDPKTNLLYYEKAVPIRLAYHLTVLTSNTADSDELVKELIFKYMQMYFITFTLPYECNRKVRFGVRIDPESIERQSGHLEYITNGTLYQTKLTLICDGCVLVSYTPAKLRRLQVEPTVATSQINKRT